MSYIFYDFETSSSNVSYGQIIQVAAVLVNDNFQLAKFIKTNMSGKKIVIGMGAGSISGWIRNLPNLI